MTNRKLFPLLLIFLSALACNLPFAPEEELSLTPSPTRIAPTPLPTSGSVQDKWDLWTGGTSLRGSNLHPCKVFEGDKCIQKITYQDIQELRDLGANVINATYPGLFKVDPPYEFDPTAQAYLDDLIDWAAQADIYIVLNYRSGPGRNEAAIHMNDGAIFDIWREQDAQDAWIEMWRFTAEHYRDSPVVIGYNLLTEPHPNILVDPDGEMEPEEVQGEIAGTLMDWNTFALEITTAIREFDQKTPIIIDSLHWANPSYFTILEPTGDSRTIYSPHMYDPDPYTMQEQDSIEIRYPDVVHYDGERIEFDLSWLEENLSPVVEFEAKYHVPIFIGEFGVMRWVPGGEEYLADLMTLFESYGWSYAYYVWRADETYFDGFNMEFGQDPGNHSLVEGNPLMEVIIERWEQNTLFPSTVDIETDPSGE